MMEFYCPTCGPTTMDIHGRCSRCGSENITQALNVIAAGRLTPSREMTGIEKMQREC